MTKTILTLLLACLLVSCINSGPGLPPPEAEALASEVPVLIRDSMRQVFYDQTLAGHNLDRVGFDSLLWKVRAEPSWVDSLYSRVGVILAEKEALD
jgi:hypothetical protein